MKKLAIFLVAAGLAACDNNISPTPTPSPDLIGNWAWVESTGGIDGRTETPANTGDQIRIEITEARIIKYVNGSITEDQEYSIYMGQSIFKTEETPIITYENGWKQSYTLKDSKLLLSDECYDCFQHEYTKNSQN